jgi:hypothetical protein
MDSGCPPDSPCPSTILFGLGLFLLSLAVGRTRPA